MKRRLFWALMGILCLVSCEDYENENVITLVDKSNTYFLSDLVGRLENKMATSIVGEFILVGNDEATTVKRGLFYLNEVKMNVRGQAIKLSNEKNVIASYPVLNQSTYVHYKDNRSTTSETRNTEGSWSINFENKQLIKPEEAAFQLSGSDYAGDMNFSYSSLDLDEIKSWYSFPAQLAAFNSEGRVGCLEYAEFFSIDLSSVDDLDLELAEDNPLTLRFENDPIFSNAARENQLWYFDLECNAWMPFSEEKYNEKEINISSGGLFAWGTFFESSEIIAEVELDGHAYVDAQIVLRDEGNNILQTSRTSSNGVFRIYAPTNRTVTLEIESSCGQVYSERIDLDSEIMELGKIQLSERRVIVKGDLLNCQNQQEKEASLFWEHEDHSGFIHLPSGNFSVALPICSNAEISTTAINLVSGEEGGSIFWDQSFHGDTILLNPLYYCSLSKDQYISITMDGETETFWTGQTSFDGERVTLSNDQTEDNFELYLSEFFQGRIPSDKVNLVFSLPELGNGGYEMNCPESDLGCGMEDFIITHYPGENGEWIRGYFEGEFWVKRLDRNSATYRRGEGSFQLFRNY